MKMRKARLVVWAKLTGPGLGLLLFTATFLYPVLPLQIASLGLITLLLAWLALLLFSTKRIHVVGIKWLTLFLIGGSIWWIIWVPRLFLPVSLQIACRFVGVGLGLIAAAGFYRSLPGKSGKLGALFPAVLLTMTFILPLGPERWNLDPFYPREVQFTPYNKLLVRLEEGPVLMFDFPSRKKETSLGFGPAPVSPSFGTTLPGWTFGLAALESGGRVTIRAITSGALDKVSEYEIQTESQPLALTSGPKSTFFLAYRTPDERVWAELKNVSWDTVLGPIELPDYSWRLAIPARTRDKIAYLSEGRAGVRVVDLATGDNHLIDLSQEITEAGGGEGTYIYSLAFSPDGEELALGLSWKGDVDCPGLVWRVDLEGKVLARLLPPTSAELRHEPFVSILAYAPDGKRLAAEVSGPPGRLAVIDVDSGRVRDLPLGDRGFTEAVFSSDGRYLVATGGGGIYMWRLRR